VTSQRAFDRSVRTPGHARRRSGHSQLPAPSR
jgi:hypothetical protein